MVATIAGGGSGINTSTVMGEDNNQPSGSGRNGDGNCDRDGNDGNGNVHGDGCDDQGDNAGGGGGGVNNGCNSDSWGAQTTIACLYPFQHWLLHSPLSRGSRSTTTSVPTAAPKRGLYKSRGLGLILTYLQFFF